MIGNTTQILKSLFGAESLDDISITRIQEVVEQYPSFHMGHYLLSKKLQQEGSEAFFNQVQRTAIHFSNPLWLQLLLEKAQQAGKPTSPELVEEIISPIGEPTETGFENNGSLLADTEIVAGVEDQTEMLEKDPEGSVLVYEHLTEEEVPIPETNITYIESRLDETILWQPAHEQNQRSETSEFGHPEDNGEAITNQEISDPGSDGDGFHPDAIAEAAVEDKAPPIDNEGLSSAEKETIELLLQQHRADGGEIQRAEPVETVRDAPPAEPSKTTTWTNQELTETSERMIAAPVQDSEFAGNRFNENLEGADQAVGEHQVASEPEQPADRAVEEIQEQLPVGEIPGDPQTSYPFQPAADEVSATDSEHTPQEDTHHAVPIQEAISPETPVQEAQSGEAELKLPDHSAEHHRGGEEAILFEPYYTIDYFASQGIRLSPDEMPTDRFGKQLKSFTDWLKVMKRLPLTTILAQSGEQDEVAIQSIAAHSNEEKDVVTETMAEVLARQGKYEKAIDLYLKLSLLNPSKSPYFAARIEELKTNLP